MVASLIYTIIGFIGLLAGLRFVLLLVGASPASPFVAWVYSWSEPFVGPFAGIFGQQSATVGQGATAQSVFDWTALVAVIVYAVIAALLARLFSHPVAYHH